MIQSQIEKILLIDDDPIVREALKSMLKERLPLAHIHGAHNLQQAYNSIQRELPQLIISDIILANGENGLHFVQELRQTGLNVPVLVLSSQTDDFAAIPALKAGANGFLSKDKAIHSGLLLEAIDVLKRGGTFLNGSVQNLQDHHDSVPSSVLNSLSAQEKRVFMGIAEGCSVKEIAFIMQLNEKTVRTYRSRICNKLGFKSDGAMIRYAIQHRIVE